MREALDAGAMGIATSRTLFHRSSDGKPIPTLDASEEELMALADTLRAKGRGVFQIVEDIQQPGASLAHMRRIAERAWTDNGQLALVPTMKLSLSVDHRVLDGASAARFLDTVVRLIEAPAQVLV